MYIYAHINNLTKHRKKTQKKTVKYQGPFTLKLFYNHTIQNKRFKIRNGGGFYVECDGRIYAFKVNVNRCNPIEPALFVPGSNKNGVKVNENCILKIFDGKQCVGEFKVCPSRHNDKLCIFNLSTVHQRVHEIFMNGCRDTDFIESLWLINTTKISKYDGEGKY